MKTFANYQQEREAFRELLKPECTRPILLIQGEAGTGKTTLMMACQDEICLPILHIPIQLRSSMVGIAEIFWRTGDCIGWELLPNFLAEVAELNRINVNIEQNRMIGINQQISVALHAENPSDRDERRTRLTTSYFSDLRELNEIFLLAIDTYEKATDEIKEWLSGPFLSRAVTKPNIRVVIAGQEIPKRGIEWGNRCNEHELQGVIEADHWIPVLQEMRRKALAEPVNAFLAGICHAFKGRPDKIMGFIQGLPRI